MIGRSRIVARLEVRCRLSRREGWMKATSIVRALFLATAAMTALVLCLLAGVGLAAFLGCALDSECSADIASWIQAVGSIAAILGAFGVARYQAQGALRTVRKQQHELLLKDCQIVAALADDILRTVFSASARVYMHKGGKRVVSDCHQIEAFLEIVRSIMPTRCPAEMVGSLIRLHRLLLDCLHAARMEDAVQLPASDLDKEEAARRAREAGECVDAIATAFQNIRRQPLA